LVQRSFSGSGACSAGMATRSSAMPLYHFRACQLYRACAVQLSWAAFLCANAEPTVTRIARIPNPAAVATGADHYQIARTRTPPTNAGLCGSGQIAIPAHYASNAPHGGLVCPCAPTIIAIHWHQRWTQADPRYVGNAMRSGRGMPPGCPLGVQPHWRGAGRLGNLRSPCHLVRLSGTIGCADGV
jgi:hypothetical protein